jgi:L-malate glycosyltransferase
VHQLIPAAAPFDAVTQQAVAWRDTLRRNGVASDIHAEHIHPGFTDEARPISRFRPHAGEGAVLHYSIWSSTAERALQLAPEQLGVNYQNITPGALLEEVNPIVAQLCDRGRRELGRLASHAKVVVAPSHFNANDLEEQGRTDVQIVPLMLPVTSPPPARATVAPAVLTVGRVVPNKRLEDSIRALAVLRKVSQSDATLDIVGSWEGFERYRQSLDQFAAALGLSAAVTFHGRVTDSERDGLYANAGAYLCLSEHEGFCAPLIEALSQGLPVVARAAGAVPETLGGAGLLLPDGDAPLVAEALALVLTDFHVRAGLHARSIRRLEALTPAHIEARLLAALAPLLGE